MKKTLLFMVGVSALLSLGSCGKQVSNSSAASSGEAPLSTSSTPTLTTSQGSDDTTFAVKLEEVFQDYNGTELWRTTINPGDTIIYGGPEPTKSYDENGMTYTWTGSWDFPVTNVQAEYIYKPLYGSGTPTICMANFYSDETKATLLYTTQVRWDNTPEYKGAWPTKEGTADYTYEFKNRWSPALGNVRQKTIDYVAQYDKASVGLTFSQTAGEATYHLASYSGSAKTVYIPSYHNQLSVDAILNNAFKGNTAIEEVYIAEGIQQMLSHIFEGCTALKKIDFPSSIQGSFTYGGFNIYGCTSFPANGWNFYNGNSSYSAPGGVFSKVSKEDDGSTHFWAMEAAYDVTSFAIDTSKYSTFGLDNGVFDGRPIESVTLPANTEVIAPESFRHCTKLTAINIPNKVTEIGKNAFDGATGLLSLSAGYLYIPSSVVTMGASVFANISGLTVKCQAASQPSGWDSTWIDKTANTVIFGA
jgi:hypothetical protein